MTEPIIVASGKQSFAPRARLVSVLGEQLIRDARVGLLELVKNSYDADASTVIVELRGLQSAETTEIVVMDDGEGMDRVTVLRQWLEPASGHKAEAKQAKIRSPRYARLPLGEKGVGRFAAHRLGHFLELTTRKAGHPEVVVRVDWDEFDNSAAYLSEVQVNWEEREPEVFSNQKTGTRLSMKRARDAWTRDEVQSVSDGLKRLMSPFRSVASFHIELKCPEYPQYQELDPGDLLTRSHAHFEGLVDTSGMMDARYAFHVPGFPERVEEVGQLDLRVSIDTKRWGAADRMPECGAFYFNFYLWHRSPATMNLTGTRRDELDDRVGVSIFRDGLRILPYGDKDDDWLSMDQQRYLKPSEALGRKSVVASIELTQTENPKLIDKTNREGLIENRAFLDLRELVRALVTVLENTWQTDRDVIEDKREEKRRARARPALEKLTNELSQLQTATGLTESATTKVVQALEKGKLDQSAVNELTEAILQLRNAVPVVDAVAKESQEKLDETVSELEDERDLLLSLAGIGLAAERFTHEFARLTREASDLIKRIAHSNPPRQIAEELDALSAIIDALRNDIKALGPMFYVRRATREKELSIKAAVANAELLNRGAFADANISFSVRGEDFTVMMREGPLTQVFNNLLDNAAFWLSRKSDETNRKLIVTINPDSREVLVSDNGPGVNPRYSARVFQPFFSTRSNGRGLGLYIVREILAEKKYLIRLLGTDEQKIGKLPSGATFLLSFVESGEAQGNAA